MMKENLDEIDDMIYLTQKTLELAIKYKEQLVKFCEEIAEMVIPLKTEAGKKQLQSITHQNYAEMIELEISIEKAQEQLRVLKTMRNINYGL